jgi:hypothetical protein
MRSTLVAALLLAPSLAVAGPKGKREAHAMTQNTGAPTTKTPSVCGIKILPLAVGNTWTYGMVPAPIPVDDSIKRLVPAQPNTIVVTVKAIDAKKGSDTVVTLEEKTTTDLTRDPKKPVIDERTITTTITCNDKTKFDISPESFWFAGEPGGYYGMKVESFEHLKGTSWQLTKGGIGDAEWREDLTAKWTRTPAEGVDSKPTTGKLELERRFTPQQPETITTKLGPYKSEKLLLITTGRVTLDGVSPDTKPMELPAGWASTLWVAEGAGVVQTLNSFAHQYQLTDVTLK